MRKINRNAVKNIIKEKTYMLKKGKKTRKKTNMLKVKRKKK